MAKRIVTKSPQAISERNIEYYPFDGKWKKIFGSPDIRFSTLVRGEAKSGKSSFLAQFAQYVSQWGRVLYISAEERLNSLTLQKCLELYNVTSPKVRFSDVRDVKFIDQLIQTGGYRFIIIDSVQHCNMSLDDWIELKLKYKRRKLSWHLIMQMGVNITRFKHEVDALVEVKDGIASVSGRFKEADSFEIFPNKKKQQQYSLFKSQ